VGSNTRKARGRVLDDGAVSKGRFWFPFTFCAIWKRSVNASSDTCGGAFALQRGLGSSDGSDGSMALRYAVRPQQFFIFFDGSCCDQKPFMVMAIFVRIGVHVRRFNPHHFAIATMLSQILAGVQKRAPWNVSTIQQMIHIVRCVVSSIDLQIACSSLIEE
jgi:hypothetical protein